MVALLDGHRDLLGATVHLALCCFVYGMKEEA